jgi:hypothetical protein
MLFDRLQIPVVAVVSPGIGDSDYSVVAVMKECIRDDRDRVVRVNASAESRRPAGVRYQLNTKPFGDHR